MIIRRMIEGEKETEIEAGGEIASKVRKDGRVKVKAKEEEMKMEEIGVWIHRHVD